MTKEPEHAAIGARLKALREAFASEMTQSEWAARHGFGVSQYNNWEIGLRRVPIEAASALADRYGLDLDWIYRGKVSGLDENARKALSSHQAICSTT